MSNQLQDAILRAVDTLVNNRIDHIQADKTIVCSVLACTNALTRSYKVSYQGGFMTAYAQEGTSYKTDDRVYVLVPQGDFSKDKQILSVTKEGASTGDSNISMVSSALSDYNLIGANTILDPNKKLPNGVSSLLKEDYLLLYQYGDEKNSLVSVDNVALTNYIKEAEALLLEASFTTKLPKKHRYSKSGKYGIQFVFAFQDGDATEAKYSAATQEIEVPKTEMNDAFPQGTSQFLLAFSEQLVSALGEKGGSYNERKINLQNLVEDYNKKISNFIQKRTSLSKYEKTVLEELQTKTKELLTDTNIQESLIPPAGVSGDKAPTMLQVEGALEQANKFMLLLVSTQGPKVKYLSYTIDSNSMTGNPFAFVSWSDQYEIFPIDSERFIHLESILLFAKDFLEDEDNPVFTDKNIFVKDLEIFGLKKIEAVNGDYRLKMNFPQGSTLRSVNKSEEITVKADVKKMNADLSDSTMFYWFAQDSRIDSSSKEYNMYGGAGWRKLSNPDDKENNKGIKNIIVTNGSENMAFENHYLCVAVYKETVILKQQFVIYNEAVKREISITSDLGTKFSFDRGVPKLTCLIDGKKSNFEADKNPGHPDEFFRFVWSITDPYGKTQCFTTTVKQLDIDIQKIKTELLELENKTPSSEEEKKKLDAKKHSLLSEKRAKEALRAEIADYRFTTEIEEDGTNLQNQFSFPIKYADKMVNVRCSVFLKDTKDGKEYSIGTGNIVLQNEGAAEPNSYSIIIENGDQVFQYNESGVSPTDERYADPLQIKPLECHFYDPTGLEVNNATYVVQWIFPQIGETMIVPPEKELEYNPENKKLEILTKKVCPIEIRPSYDYQALNNQVRARVKYGNETYEEYTKFLFTKVGENGTNGTDIVTKISPTSKSSILNKEVLTLEVDNLEQDEKKKLSWNTGQTPEAPVLRFDLYERNLRIDDLGGKTVDWKVCEGNQSKYLSIGITKPQECGLSWNLSQAEAKKKKFRSQIIRGAVSRDGDIHYAFYPLPVVYYNLPKDMRYHVGVNKDKTLKSITYNADGRNPLYNKNQGVYLDLDTKQEKYIVWSAEGGLPLGDTVNGFIDSPTNAIFNLSYNKTLKDSRLINTEYQDEGFSAPYKEPKQTIVPRELVLEKDDAGNPTQTKPEFMNFCHIQANDIYSGEFTNHLVHAKIYANKNAYDKQALPEVEVYVPIYISLNTYGLKSLNAWDGNHIEINENNDYILAPQIGAGKKDAENKFTGIVMGVAKTYDQEQLKQEEDIGLLGYSKGKQSIFLDSKTGNAIFGLPEHQASQENNFEEGRIELIPGGESKIGRWNIGSRGIYNITEPIVVKNADGEFVNNGGKNQQYKGVKPDKPYKDFPVVGAQMSVPFKAQGMILNANPAYFSVKGMPLTKKNSNIDWSAANLTLREGDSLEVEIDPSKDSTFSIYRHTYKTRRNAQGELEYINDKGEVVKDKEKAGTKRYPLVGINSSGQFYTNAVENNNSSMGIGSVGAFGLNASEDRYIGAQFATQDTNKRQSNILKFFVDNLDKMEQPLPEGVGIDTSPVYLTAGTTVFDEYPRPFQIYGKEVSLFAGNVGKLTSSLSPFRVTVGYDNTIIGDYTKTVEPIIDFKTKEQAKDEQGKPLFNTIEDGNFLRLQHNVSKEQPSLFKTKNNFDVLISDNNQNGKMRVKLNDFDVIGLREDGICSFNFGNNIDFFSRDGTISMKSSGIKSEIGPKQLCFGDYGINKEGKEEYQKKLFFGELDGAKGMRISFATKYFMTASREIRVEAFDPSTANMNSNIVLGAYTNHSGNKVVPGSELKLFGKNDSSTTYSSWSISGPQGGLHCKSKGVAGISNSGTNVIEATSPLVSPWIYLSNESSANLTFASSLVSLGNLQMVGSNRGLVWSTASGKNEENYCCNVSHPIVSTSKSGGYWTTSTTHSFVMRNWVFTLDDYAFMYYNCNKHLPNAISNTVTRIKGVENETDSLFSSISTINDNIAGLDGRISRLEGKAKNFVTASDLEAIENKIQTMKKMYNSHIHKVLGSSTIDPPTPLM